MILKNGGNNGPEEYNNENYYRNERTFFHNALHCIRIMQGIRIMQRIRIMQYPDDEGAGKTLPACVSAINNDRRTSHEV